jgi:uncharacterized protein
MTASVVLGIAETREQLPHLVKAMSADPTHPGVVIGSHRNPQVILAPLSMPKRSSGPSMELLRSKLPLFRTLATAHRLSTVAVFGSVARGEASHTSDVDLLCGTMPGTTLLDIAAFEEEMEMALGFPITVLTRNSLTRDDETILKDAIELC